MGCGVNDDPPQPPVKTATRQRTHKKTERPYRSTIDGGESELLSSRLKKLVANGVRKLLLNLADLIQVDSSGVSIIVGTYVSLRAKGGALKLLCPCGRVLEVLRILHLLEIIPSFEDETQALASFRPLSYFARP
jgi:anti-anti-sigma factor